MNDIKKLMLASPLLMAAVTAQAIDFKGVIIDGRAAYRGNSADRRNNNRRGDRHRRKIRD